MAKIKGKFAPMMDELAEDERWLLQCDDNQKFLYMMILFTIYTTNGTAPDDARYYIVRYNLQRRIDRVTGDLQHIKSLFPKLIAKDKKLSLLNSKLCVNRVDDKKSLEEEEEGELEKEVEGEGENVPRETNLNPLDPTNILACDLFARLTPFQKKTIIGQYSPEFLANRLSAYVSSAAQKNIFTMNPTTVFEWLERDYRETQKPRIEKPKTKLEKTREALSDFAETQSEDLCQRDGDFSGVVPVPRLSGPEEGSDDLRPA